MKGHLRERSPGRWAIVLETRDPATGKRRRKWHSFKGTTRQAQDECTRLLAEMGNGTYVGPSKLTLAAFLEQWLEHTKSRVSPRTHERYAEICRVLKAALGRAVRWEMLARNPAEAVDPPRVERKTMLTYDLTQTAKLLEALQGDRLARA